MAALQQFNLLQTILIFFAAFIIGLTKSGLKGIDLLTVTVTAFVFGSKQSTGKYCLCLFWAIFWQFYIIEGTPNGHYFGN